MEQLRTTTLQMLAAILTAVLTISSTASANITKREAKDLKIVCYYSNWAIYRPGVAKFTPENINPFLCTHLIYAFAGMNKDYELKPFDSYNDIQQGNYKKFVNLKTYNSKLKLMIAVGGWNEGSKRFTKMVESSDNRKKFIRGALRFLRQHGFDGLDLDWEYPGFRDGGQDEDKEGYADLVKELREAFDSESVPRGKSRLLLTMAVPAGQQYIDKGFDVPTLSDNLDFLNLLTYDYHTAHEPLTDHHSPLYSRPDLADWDPNKQLNVEWTVKYYLKLGADRRKLIIGIPTYGRSYTLQDPDENEIGSPTDGPGEKGTATREKGYLAYYEICQNIQDEGWELEAPYPEAMGPYAYKDDQWVGFDDEEIIMEKAKYVLEQGLGGAMIWTLDNDDFRGSCYGEQSPLISTLRAALLEGSTATTTARPTTTTSAPKVRSRPTPRRRQQTQRNQKSSSNDEDGGKASRTTAAPFTTPDPGPPFECTDEGFFPNPVDCKKYFWCLDSGPSDLGLIPNAFTCPSGLHFNPRRDACDYPENVQCKAKPIAATTTTRRPRPRPRPRTTTTTTTTTTTEAPAKQMPEQLKKDLEGVSSPLNSINMNGQNILELLQLLQTLGSVNQIHDKLQGRDSAADAATTTTTLSPTLPEYRTPNRKRIASTQDPPTESPVDIFTQYATPNRRSKSETSDTRSVPTVKPRGPQFYAPSSEEESDSVVTPRSTDGEDFPFVYHTPNRQQTTAKPRDTEAPRARTVEYVLEDQLPRSRQSQQAGAAGPRRVVVRIRPVPGERSQNNPLDALFIKADQRTDADEPSERRGNNYVLAQTVGIRRVVRPGISEESSIQSESQEDRSEVNLPSSRPAVRRVRPGYQSADSKVDSSEEEYSDSPAITQLVSKVATSSRPAVTRRPQTARPSRRPTPAPKRQETKTPPLVLTPDGSVTCKRRGVFIHPNTCGKFLVCVPAEDGGSGIDGYVHDCPAEHYFMEEGGRCMPGDRSECDKYRQ